MARFDPNQYVDVQERIGRFWREYPDGAITTRLMSPPDDFDQCRYEASVYKHRDDHRPSGMGYAFELKGGSGANQTSHEENCETSAIGRALANMGYATTREDRPSRQEMQKVERASQPQPRNAPVARQDAPEPIKPAPRTNTIPKDAEMAQPALPGAGNVDANWLAVIADVRTKAQLAEVHAELSKANPSRAVWDAYGTRAKAINATS